MAKTITVPVSDELHMQFKNYCTTKDLKMKDAIVLAMQILLERKK